MVTFAARFISGRYQGGEFPLPEQGELILGRSSDLDLVLSEDMVSRKHAKISVEGGGISIMDLGSTNGTFVNGEKIKRSDLRLNDRVLIGTSIIKIINGDDMAIEPDMDAARDMLRELGSRTMEASAMSGSLEEVPLPDLLQLFTTNRKSGVLTITGDHQGKVYIKDGMLRFAVISDAPNMPAMKALCRMMGWDRGAFELADFNDDPGIPVAFEGSTESLLMESLRQYDELQRLLQELPQGPGAIRPCSPLVPKLADLSPLGLEVFQAANNIQSVRGILDHTNDTDFHAANEIKKLLDGGYLEPTG